MEGLSIEDSQPSFYRDETGYTETIHGFDEDERPPETPNAAYVDTSRPPEGLEEPQEKAPVLMTEVRRQRTRTFLDDTPNFEPSDGEKRGREPAIRIIFDHK